jgi:CubicO group peptidase (beta-lactamase class C family)
MNRNVVSLLASAAAALIAPAAAAGQQPAPLATLDAYVVKAMREWEVPGVAIAVVKGDSVVYARGFGVRTLGRPDAVDERTLFAIGSATKAFTATAVGMLVDDGKVRWDDPVAQYLGGFQLYDPYATRELRVRDALSHRSGLARGDLLWYGTSYDRDEILRRVRHLRPSWSLRSSFGYQNIMYIAAGQIVAKVTGTPWDDFTRERILAPLGMTATVTSVAGLRGQPNVAMPHARINDTVRAIAYRNIDNVGPAGSINSNVLDMAKWVRFQLDSGKVGGKTLLTAGSYVETHTPHTIVRRTAQARQASPFTHFSSYGLGWFLEDYRGREVVHHGGNIDGMSALVGMLPAERLGVVVLTNMNGTALPTVLMRRVFDLYLGVPEKDWSADLLKLAKQQIAQAKEIERKRDSARVAGTRPSLALEKYVGAYLDSLYGEGRVRMENGRLVLTLGPAFVGDLEHWHYDTFRARWRDRLLGSMLVAFTLNTAGEVDGFKPERGPGAIPEDAPAYRRIVDPADTVPKVRIAEADLRRLTGAWESKAPPLTVTVELVGGALKLTVPGQPVYTLVAMTPTRFKLTGPPEMPPGYVLEYQVDGGAVRGMTLQQPAPQPTLQFAKQAKRP